MNILSKGIIVLFIIVFSFSFLNAEDISFSISILPGISDMKDGKPSGPFVDIFNEMAAHYKDGKLVLKGLYPIDRSISYAVNGTVDCHFPLIRTSNLDLTKLSYDFVPESLGQVTFVLYTLDGAKPLDMKNLGQYKIDIVQGHSQYLPFKATESFDAVQSFQKIMAGRIDGYIDAQESADVVLKLNKFKNIKRQFYGPMDSVLIVAKTPRGEKVKNIISNILKKMKEDKSLYKYAGKVLFFPYNDWQPSKMGW